MTEIYHVTALNRLEKILEEGLSRFEEPLSKEVIREEVGVEGDEEDEGFRDCNQEAQNAMEELLDRGDNVYFWIDIDRAYASMAGLKDLKLDLVVVVVDTEKLPCNCTVSDATTADDIYDEFYRACNQEIMVDEDTIQFLLRNLKDQPYNPLTNYPDCYEVRCPCDVPASAILHVLDRNRNAIKPAGASEEDVLQILKTSMQAKVVEETDELPEVPYTAELILISCGRCDPCRAFEKLLTGYRLGRVIDYDSNEAQELLLNISSTSKLFDSEVIRKYKGPFIKFLHPLLIANGDPQYQFIDSAPTEEEFTSWYELYYGEEVPL